MDEKIESRTISVAEWRRKVRTSETRWLTMQYRGLKTLINGLDELYDTQFDIVKERYGGSIPDGIYSEYFYPIEDERMEMDIQLVDIEEELEERGIKVI